MTIVARNDGYSAQQGDGTVREAIPVFDAGLSSIGTGPTHLAKAEDAPHTSSDVGIAVWGVRTPTVAVATTSADGDYSALAVNQYSNLKVDLVDSTGTELVYNANGRAADASSTPVALSTENVASLTALLAVYNNSFQNITTSTTTTVKSGAGTLHTITINSLGTVASSVTVYNNTAGSGTKIATINSLSVLGTLTFDVAFSTGLTLVTTGTVAPDVTVSYR